MRHVSILVGDVRARLAALPDASVHCVVTSPPYWNLRDYGTTGQLGLEPTPDAYVAALVRVFRDVRRVLRDDGVCWLNLGDTYSGDRGEGLRGATIGRRRDRASVPRSDVTVRGLAKKNLLGLPWRVALALQADGWCLRCDVVWHKPGPMPESCTDRPTRAHEFVFLLTKRPRYFYDRDAIAEPVAGTARPRGSADAIAAEADRRAAGGTTTGGRVGVNPKSAGRLFGVKQNASWSTSVALPVATRNRRSVWRIKTHPFPGAHFATMPPALVDLCIRAGTSEHGACAACGAPWVRVIAKGAANRAHQQACGGDADGQYHGTATKAYAAARAQDPSAVKARILAGMVERRTVGWRPSCGCGAPVRPCVVLDPFGGACTTALVAARLGRDSIVLELNAEYAGLGAARVRDDAPLLNVVTVEPPPVAPPLELATAGLRCNICLADVAAGQPHAAACANGGPEPAAPEALPDALRRLAGAGGDAVLLAAADYIEALEGQQFDAEHARYAAACAAGKVQAAEFFKGEHHVVREDARRADGDQRGTADGGRPARGAGRRRGVERRPGPHAGPAGVAGDAGARAGDLQPA
jgi:DNA modification methylase